MMRPSKAAAAEHACCKKKQPPSEDKAPAPFTCCKTLKASFAETEHRLWAPPFQFEIVYAVFVSVAESVSRDATVATEHGTPNRVSFAELVLQQSLLSHTPPTLF